MSKRILFGGLLAVGLSLALGSTAQAQHYGHNHGGYNHGGRGYGGYGGGYHHHHHHGGYGYGNAYRPVIVAPVYRPAVISPFSTFGTPYLGGYGYGSPYLGGYGYGSYSNFSYSRPGFGINIGFGR